MAVAGNHVPNCVSHPSQRRIPPFQGCCQTDIDSSTDEHLRVQVVEYGQLVWSIRSGSGLVKPQHLGSLPSLRCKAPEILFRTAPSFLQVTSSLLSSLETEYPVQGDPIKHCVECYICVIRELSELQKEPRHQEWAIHVHTISLVKRARKLVELTNAEPIQLRASA